MRTRAIQIGNAQCIIYGDGPVEYILLQMTGEHEGQSLNEEVVKIAQNTKHTFMLAAIPVQNWNDDLSPWQAPAVWGKVGFGGKAPETLSFMTKQVIPTLTQRFQLTENVKIVLGGYSLAGLFALWSATRTDLFYGIAAASPSVWFPGWMEYEQQYPIRGQRIYLSLGDREESTKNSVMASVGRNLRTLYHRLEEDGKDCVLEWNRGGHFKDTALRTANAFRCIMDHE